jgi:hypothetical protein
VEALGGRGIAPTHLYRGTNRGKWSASRLGRGLALGKGPPVPIGQEAGWAPESVWTQRIEETFFASTGDRTPIAWSVTIITLVETIGLVIVVSSSSFHGLGEIPVPACLIVVCNNTDRENLFSMIINIFPVVPNWNIGPLSGFL